jgi:5-methylcytosine-specific restriction endonuclease McrBC GTP-binding regulatory subunit McrB
MRKETGSKDEMNKETKDFIKFYCNKWRSSSIFQVLLRYRAARYQDLVHFSQQVFSFYILHIEIKKYYNIFQVIFNKVTFTSRYNPSTILCIASKIISKSLLKLRSNLSL